MAIYIKREISNKKSWAFLSFKFLCRKNGGGKTKLDMKLTDLADYICVDRSAMMRELRKLKDEGKVKIENKIVELNIWR